MRVIYSAYYDRPNICFETEEDFKVALQDGYILVQYKDTGRQELHTTEILRAFANDAFKPEGTYIVAKYK